MRFSDKNGSQSLEIEDLDIRRLLFFAFNILFVKLVLDQAINGLRRVETFNRQPRVVRTGAQLACLLVLEQSEIERESSPMLQRFGPFNRNPADFERRIVRNDERSGFQVLQEDPATELF